jgi:GAF domain-containing protein
VAEVLAVPGPWKSGHPRGEGDGALMNLPLVSGTRLVGVARIESFLPQKAEFNDDDHGLLELVSEHSGIGIETAWIRAHAKEVPFARSALEGLVVT